MGFFSKNGDDKSDGSPVTPTVDSDAASRTAALEDFAEKVLDTLAGMLRDYGNFGFDTEAMDSAELERHCDAWARHMLTGTPAPVQGEELLEQETVERVHLYDRSQPDMHRFFRGHRREEQAAVLGSAKGMRSLISQMTNGLRSAIVEDGAADEKIRQEMVAVGKVMQGNSLEDIRAQLGKTIDLVSRVTMARQARYEEQLQSMADNVRKLRDAGVTILAGSDTQSGVFPGAGLHRELAHLVQAGMTPTQAIRAATLDAADFLAAGGAIKYGAVEVGLAADLLVVDDDPTQNIGNLQKIRYLIQGGKIVERTAIGQVATQ